MNRDPGSLAAARAGTYRAGVAGNLFDQYLTEGHFDEVFEADGTPRAHYAGLVGRLSALDAEDLARRERARDASFRSQGITFTVYGEGEGIERTFPMDLLPRVVPAARVGPRGGGAGAAGDAR